MGFRARRYGDIQMYALPGSSQTTKVLTNIPTLLVVDSAVKIVSETFHPAQRSLFIADSCSANIIYCTNAYTCTCTLPLQIYALPARETLLTVPTLLVGEVLY